jgi:hypothetical protein
MTIKQILTALETAEKQLEKVRDALEQGDMRPRISSGLPADVLGRVRALKINIAGIIKASELK